MPIVERSSLNAPRRVVGGIASAVAATLVLVGCTTEAPAKPTSSEIVTTISAWLEDRPAVLDTEEVPGPRDGRIVLEVEVQPDINDAEIRAIGDYLATMPHTVSVSVDISAGDDIWSTFPGSEPDGIVETLIWLRNDPRVISADVDALTATGTVRLADVFETAAQFHDAMQGLNPHQRLVTEQSEVGAGAYGLGTQVEVVAEKPYPTEAVEAAEKVLAAYPASMVSVSLLEGSYELRTRAVFDASVDIADARRVVTDAFATLVPAAGISVTVGVANATLDELTDERIAFVRAMIGAAEVTKVEFGAFGSDAPDFTVTGSAASWAAANDAVIATLAEPSLGHWTFGEQRAQAPALAAGDPYRSLIPSLLSLTETRSITYAEGELLVDLDSDVGDAELSMLVTAIRQSGLASTIVLSLRSHDDDDERHRWAKVVDGAILPGESDSTFSDLGERFTAIWSR